MLTAIQILELRNESENIQKQNASLKQERSQLESKIESLTLFLKAKQSQLDRINSDIENRNTLTKEIEELKKQYLFLIERNSNETSILNSLKKQIKQEQDNLNAIKKYQDQFV